MSYWYSLRRTGSWTHLNITESDSLNTFICLELVTR